MHAKYILFFLDNSDEKDCTCKDYIDVDKICDGFDDCPNGEDEHDCYCPGKFFCGSFDQEVSSFCFRKAKAQNPDTCFSFNPVQIQIPICIDSDRRCDNIDDCESGADEQYCFELSPDMMRPEITSQPKDKGKYSRYIIYRRLRQ